MNIRPSAAIRQNYNEIAEMCRKTAEPVFLTKNGEGDLVVMDIGTFNRRETRLWQLTPYFLEPKLTQIPYKCPCIRAFLFFKTLAKFIFMCYNNGVSGVI